jgi:hypothetical protein
MRTLLSLLVLAVGVALNLAWSQRAPAQAPTPKKNLDKVQLKPGKRVQGTVSQLDTARRRLLVQTAKGTVELSDRVTVHLSDGRSVQESLAKPRVLKKGVGVIVVRLPDGRIIIIIVREGSPAVEGAVSQLDTTRRKAVIKTAKGTVELSDRVNVQLNDGRVVQEDLGKPRNLRNGEEVLVISRNFLVLIGKKS